MKVFSYEAIKSKDDQIENRAQGLKLVMTAFCAQSLIHRHKNKGSADDNNLAFDYYDECIKAVSDFEKDAQLRKLDKTMVSSALALKADMKQVYEQVTTKPTARPILSEFDTMMIFFVETAKKNLDSFEVLSNYMETKAGAGLHHHCSIEISHAKIKWVFSFIQSGMKSVTRKITINGQDNIDVGGYDANYLKMLFGIVTMMKQQDLIDSIKADAVMKKYPDSAAKAKAMQKILGGEWMDYLELSAYLSDKGVMADMGDDRENGIENLLYNKLNTDEHSIKEAVKVFSSKPLYH